MSDGQLVPIPEKLDQVQIATNSATAQMYRKAHDELQQLRDKLAAIRAKGGWTSEIPTEEGQYWLRRKGLEPFVALILQRRLPGRLFVLDPSRCYCLTVEWYAREGYEFARVLTPEDLE